ncbi:hypothetical protein [Promicromonospora sp. NFX87]|uniref:hypothetical protein n=1 Tax=Promicromonospora sp. NFX87 TaxID=3402691 RepID=UPI003AFA2BE7
MYEIESLTSTISAHSAVYADGLFDFVETQASEATQALYAVVILCVVATVAGIVIKTRMAAAAVFVVCLMGGLVLWLVVGGGIQLISQLAGEQFASAALTVPLAV